MCYMMKKKSAVICLLMCILFFTGCAQKSESGQSSTEAAVPETAVSTQTAHSIDTSAALLKETDSETEAASFVENAALHKETETEQPTPCVHEKDGFGEGFQSIREMQYQLEQDLFDKSRKTENFYQYPDAYYELKGVPERYKEVSVEWYGGMEYTITYGSEAGLLAYQPFDTTDNLKASMNAAFANNGTYEALKNNPLVSHIRVSSEDTEFGTKTIYTYDTKIKTDLINTYIEYYHQANDTTYIVSEKYSPEFNYANIFVFHEDAPFMCYCFDSALTFEEILNLTSAKLDE